MTHKGKRKSAAVYLAAGFLLTCCLAQTIDCYRLRKAERREGRSRADAAAAGGVQEGKIVFGGVSGNRSGLESRVSDGTGKTPSNASVEDESAYQADFAGWSKGQVHDVGPKEASWKRMAPSLQCAPDQMKFRALGPGASQFAVEQGAGPPTPLSQVPSSCGYNMQRNSLSLVMLVPYDGCNMVQEGASYMLPMRWQGIPVSLWCPKPAAPAPTADSHHPVPQTPRYPSMPQKPEVSHPKIPQSYFFPPYLPYPQYPSVAVAKPEMPKFPQFYPFFPPFYPYFNPPQVTTAAPGAKNTPSTTAKPAATTSAPVFPLPFYPPFYPFPWPLPQPTTAGTTATQTTTTKPTPKPQLPQFPPYMPVFPQYPPYLFPPFMPQYPTTKPETPPTTTTTTTTTTTKKTTDAILTPPPHDHPHFHPHDHLFPFIQFPPHYPPPAG